MRTSHTPKWVLIAVAVLGLGGVWLLVAGLSSAPGGEAATPTSPQTETTSSPPAPEPSSVSPPEPAAPEAPSSTITAGSSAEGPEPAPADSSAVEAAEDAAAQFMVAWFDTRSSSWWSRLEILMTPDAAAIYDSVDPAEIPADQSITGAESIAGASEEICMVEVHTSLGTYLLTLFRDEPSQPWLVERLDQSEVDS